MLGGLIITGIAGGASIIVFRAALHGFVRVLNWLADIAFDVEAAERHEAINHTSHNLPECGDIRCAQIINESLRRQRGQLDRGDSSSVRVTPVFRSFHDGVDSRGK